MIIYSEQVRKICERFLQHMPDPQGELFYTNAYTLLVAVVLSARATDKGVNKVTHSLFQDISTPEDVLALPEGALEERIKTIGLYPTKAQNIRKAAVILKESYHSQVPDTCEALMTLPGVGRKTAHVVLNIAFGKPTIAVDTHVFRVSHRLKWADASTPDGVTDQLMSIIPPEYLMKAHHWLVLHGRYVCKAQKPLCVDCFLKDLCPSAH